MSGWGPKFFSSTRGRIVSLLRRGSRTVEDLAQAVDLTDNAVRSHLTALERDGLVEQRGVRRGVGKPAYSYELTTQAERLFPKPYAPVLGELLDTLAEGMEPAQMEDLLRSVGRRMAAARAAPAGDVQARLEAGVAVLNELGGLAELEENEGAVIIRGYSCPLPAVVRRRPEVCLLAESLLTELTGVEVRQHCDRGERPRCCFEVHLPGGAEAMEAAARYSAGRKG